VSPKPAAPALRDCLAQISLFFLIAVFASAPLVLLPMHVCPQPCCDAPGKLRRLKGIPGVSAQEAQKMLEWADQFPCVYSGMNKKVNLFRLWMY
jgi:hypothetical protein